MEVNPSIFFNLFNMHRLKTFPLEVPYLFCLHSQSTFNKSSSPESDFAGVMWSLQIQDLNHDTVM